MSFSFICSFDYPQISLRRSVSIVHDPPSPSSQECHAAAHPIAHPKPAELHNQTRPNRPFSYENEKTYAWIVSFVISRSPVQARRVAPSK
jgi:hypothetical protein